MTESQNARANRYLLIDYERFEAKYIPEPNSGCWLWLGALNWNGYGLIRCVRFDYDTAPAHILAWELYRGPRGDLNVLHSCDNRLCVNPDHLRLGTQKENVQDRDSRQRRRAPKGTLNGRAVLTESDVLAIRADTRKKTDIARAYSVGFTAVHDIKIRRSWKHIP